MINFIKEANQAENIALQENPERIRYFLKKIGSNFRIAERALVLDLKNAWKIPAKFNAERRSREATNPRIGECVNWRCILKIARTEFAPRPASRNSE